MTVYDEQVRPSIVVEVNTTSSPSEIGDGYGADARFTGSLCKGHCPIVPIEGVALIFKIGDVNGEAAAMVEVTRSNSHACHFAAIAADRCPGDKAHVGETPISVVAVQIIRS